MGTNPDLPALRELWSDNQKLLAVILDDLVDANLDDIARGLRAFGRDFGKLRDLSLAAAPRTGDPQYNLRDKETGEVYREVRRFGINGLMWVDLAHPAHTLPEQRRQVRADAFDTLFEPVPALPPSSHAPQDEPRERLMLNAYGRQCWDSGFEYGKRASSHAAPPK